ncbi:oligosaccharide flippase family protein [Alcanivorax sediminis]|uniref:Oligosaccharide flippase family protein n=1 Tax=Alcanivorax sediminis TaxID=2663008 RepID=A0A6N7LZ50_9GAMM|nr:oligosaccharide flippase family protein [Alcanivorax sediminis]MQX54385.1 oligosaccharide flippase family protein [Alcanivorax sediminis]
MMDQAKRRVVKNMFSLLSLKGVDVLVPLVVTPYLVRVVGLEKFGLIAFSLSFAAYFGALINYGFNITAARDIARCRESGEEVSRIYSNTMAAIGILSVFTLLLSSMLIALMNVDEWLFFGAVFLVIFQSSLPVWMFVGHERMTLVAVLGAFSKVVYVFSLFALVQSEDDYIYVNALYAASALLTLILSMVLVKLLLKVNFSGGGVKGVKSSFKSGFSVFVMQVSPVLYNNSSTFILGLVAAPAAVGVYSAAMRVVEVCITLGRLIANAFLPYVAVDMRSRHGYFAKLMLLIGGVATLMTFVFSEFISTLLYSTEGAQVAIWLEWLSPSILFGFFYLVYGVGYMPLAGQEKAAAKISLTVSLVGLLMLLVFVPMFYLMAVVLVLVGSRFLLAVISYCYYRKSLLV